MGYEESGRQIQICITEEGGELRMGRGTNPVCLQRRECIVNQAWFCIIEEEQRECGKGSGGGAGGG